VPESAAAGDEQSIERIRPKIKAGTRQLELPFVLIKASLPPSYLSLILPNSGWSYTLISQRADLRQTYIFLRKDRIKTKVKEKIWDVTLARYG
jgi:hypothetical protein